MSEALLQLRNLGRQYPAGDEVPDVLLLDAVVVVSDCTDSGAGSMVRSLP